MMRTAKMVFALSGVVGLVASIGSPVLLPYPLFVLVYLRGWRFPRVGSPGVRLLLSTLLCTTILEFGAWLDNFLRDSPEPALLHPQLIPDLILGVGIYLAWWFTWWLALRRYHFTTRQVFVVTGLYGVLIEQSGRVFLAGLVALPLGVFLWLFVAVAYGATMALAVFLVRDSFTPQRESWVKYSLVWCGLFVLTIGVFYVWALVWQVINILPPPKLPMRDFPLW